MKSVVDESDVERLAAFNGIIHGPEVAGMTRELILHHPKTRPDQWFFVEDQANGQVVSALCLIPWTWRYQDVELSIGEAGIIGTLEPYRRRGLVRAQFARHEEMMREGGYDLGIIQGIPYFYRQFGYEYALPLEGGWRIELHLVPGAPATGEDAYTFRQATLEDIPTLARFYDEAATDLEISTIRDKVVWEYLFGPSLRTETVAETWLISTRASAPVGYLRVPQHGFGEGLIVNEVSRLSSDSALAALRHVKALATQRSKPYIRLCLPSRSMLVQVARGRGAHDQGTYAWQIHVVDVGRLLLKLAPVLERRLAASPFSGLTRDLVLNLYREAFELHFREGRLVAVDALGFSGKGGIRLPPFLAAPLILGYRSREELQRFYHDVSVPGDIQYLVDVLFPPVVSYIFTNY